MFKLSLRSNKKILIKKVKFKDNDNTKHINYLIIPKTLLNKKSNPCFIYIHGGGFVYKGAPHQYKNAKEYALKANCIVYYIDYRIIKKYPTSINDCISSFKFLIVNKEKFNIDITNIGVGGDSAGGYLSVDLMYRLSLLNKQYSFKYAMLFYPFLDSDINDDSNKQYFDTPMWNSNLTKKLIPYYFKNQKPLDFNHFKNLDFVCNNVYIETCQFDCLHDQSILFYKKLKQLNKNVVLNETLKTMHGYDIKQNSPITIENINIRIKNLNNFIKL